VQFNKTAVAGNGNLLVPGIQSPNFDKANQTGWQINKDGSLYAADIELPNLDTGTTVTFSSTAPADPSNGDIWYDVADGLLAYSYSGTTDTWTPYSIGTGAIASGAVTTDLVDFTARDIGSNVVSYSPTAPSNPQVGDIWIQTQS
jgi:hypothetical protein